jgi:hypothetical protein
MNKYIITKLMYRDMKQRTEIKDCRFDNRDDAVNKLKEMLSKFDTSKNNPNSLPFEIFAWTKYQCCIEELNLYQNLLNDKFFKGDWIGKKVN